MQHVQFKEHLQVSSPSQPRCGGPLYPIWRPSGSVSRAWPRAYLPQLKVTFFLGHALLLVLLVLA